MLDICLPLSISAGEMGSGLQLSPGQEVRGVYHGGLVTRLSRRQREHFPQVSNLQSFLQSDMELVSSLMASLQF